MAVNLLTTNVIVAQITRLIAIGTVFSLILVFTLLPSILSLKERAARKLYIRMGKGDPDEGKDNVPIYDKKAQAKGLAKAKAIGLKGVIFGGVSADTLEPVTETAAAAPAEPVAKEDNPVEAVFGKSEKAKKTDKENPVNTVFEKSETVYKKDKKKKDK